MGAWGCELPEVVVLGLETRFVRTVVAAESCSLDAVKAGAGGGFGDWDLEEAMLMSMSMLYWGV